MLIHDTIKQMRYLSENGIPFSIEFISCNHTTEQSKGVVVANNVLLRKGRATDYDTLVAYTNLESDEPKHFHLPLLTKFNGTFIRHEH